MRYHQQFKDWDEVANVFYAFTGGGFRIGKVIEACGNGVKPVLYISVA